MCTSHLCESLQSGIPGLGMEGGRRNGHRGNHGPVDPFHKAQGMAFQEHRPQLALVTLLHLRP